MRNPAIQNHVQLTPSAEFTPPIFAVGDWVFYRSRKNPKEAFPVVIIEDYGVKNVGRDSIPRMGYVALSFRGERSFVTAGELSRPDSGAHHLKLVRD